MVKSVGIREFRAGLGGLIAAGETVEVTRRGQLVAVFMPMGRPRRFDVEAFLEVVGEVRGALQGAGVDPADVVRDFEEIRHSR